MHEYFGDAVVLTKDPNGDLDNKVSFFTKRFGKIFARAKSSRRITSKLSGHLEPGNLIQFRAVEKNGVQIVDALKVGALPIAPPVLCVLASLLPEFDPDPSLWQLLTHETFGWERALRILGWDPARAACARCGKTPIEYFASQGQEFFCIRCAPPRSAGGVRIKLRRGSPSPTGSLRRDVYKSPEGCSL